MSKRRPAGPREQEHEQEDEKRNQQQSGFQLFRDLICVALTNMKRVQILGRLSSTVLQIWSSPAGGWRGSEVFLYLLLAFQVGQNKYLWILALSIELRDLVNAQCWNLIWANVWRLDIGIRICLFSLKYAVLNMCIYSDICVEIRDRHLDLFVFLKNEYAVLNIRIYAHGWLAEW